MRRLQLAQVVDRQRQLGVGAQLRPLVACEAAEGRIERPTIDDGVHGLSQVPSPDRAEPLRMILIARSLAFEQARSTPCFSAPPSAKKLRTTDRTPPFRPFHAVALGPFGAK